MHMPYSACTEVRQTQNSDIVKPKYHHETKNVFCLCYQNEMKLKDTRHALRKDRFARIPLGLIKEESFEIPLSFPAFPG